MERRKGGQILSHFVCVLFHFQNFSKAKIDLGKTRSFVKYLDSHGTPADVQFLFFLVESLGIQVKLEDPFGKHLLRFEENVLSTSRKRFGSHLRGGGAGMGCPGNAGGPPIDAWFMSPESSKNFGPLFLSKLRCRTMVLWGPWHLLINSLSSGSVSVLL